MTHPTYTPGPYGRLAAWILAHRKPTGLSLLVLGMISAFLASFLQVDANILSLLPEDDPHAAAFFDLYEEQGGTAILTLVIEAEDPEDPENLQQLDQALDELTEELEALDSVRYALHEVDPKLAYQIGLMQLEAADVNELSVRLKGALALGPALNPMVTQRLMDMGPLAQRISKVFDMPYLTGKPGQGRVIARPLGAAQDSQFSKAFMEEVDAILAKTQLEERGLELIWMGGPYRHNVEDMEAVRSDLLYVSLISTVLVLLVIGLAFRSWRATLLVFVPLVLSNAVNLAMVWLSIGHINTFTSFGTAILVGLGIALAVHLVGRYREERAGGRGLEEAVIRAWDRTGPPTTTAALTSSAGFIALAVADCRGFSQLGTLLALGMVFALAAVLVVLPILIPTLDPAPKALLGARPDLKIRSRSTYRLAPLGIMAAAILSVLAVPRLADMEWEFDMSTLRSAGRAYEEFSEEEQELVRQSTPPVLVSFDSREELLAEQERLEKLVDTGLLPHVSAVFSIEDVLPADQEHRLRALSELARLTQHRNLRYLPPPLVKHLLPLRDWEPQLLAREDLPPAMLDLLMAQDPEQHSLMILPKGNMWDLRMARDFKHEVSAAMPDRIPAGSLTAKGALLDVVNRDMPLVSILALLLVAVLTAIDLRRVPEVLGAMGILLAGMVWAGVVLDLFAVKLSIVNIVGVPILLGIGIDVVVHLMHRLREEGPGGVRRMFLTTGVAATVAVASTAVSFASLLFASSRGVRSLGLLVTIGLITVFAATLVLVPLAWAAGWKLSGKAPADQPEA